MSRKNRVLKTLSKHWLNKIPPEEIEQEELIQKWKYPELEGYQGLLALRTLLYSKYKELEISSKEVPLKKNTLDKTSGVLSLSFLISELIFDKKNVEYSFMLQPLIKSYYYGIDISSIDKRAEYMLLPRSSLGRHLDSIRKTL